MNGILMTDIYIEHCSEQLCISSKSIVKSCKFDRTQLEVDRYYGKSSLQANPNIFWENYSNFPFLVSQWPNRLGLCNTFVQICVNSYAGHHNFDNCYHCHGMRTMFHVQCSHYIKCIYNMSLMYSKMERECRDFKISNDS